MSKIGIGDRVKCIDSSGKNLLKKGREYVVEGFWNCRSCGKVALYVGVPNPHFTERCAHKIECDCGDIVSSEDIMNHPHKIERFVKADEKVEYKSVKMDIEIEEPVLN